MTGAILDENRSIFIVRNAVIIQTYQFIDFREVQPNMKRDVGMKILAMSPISSRASGGKGPYF
jgi:hypothetical protein